MSKYNEQWEVVSREKIKHDFHAHMACKQEYTVWDVVEGDQVVFTCYDEEIANHIVLCVNTLAGIPDKEVERVAKDRLEMSKDVIKISNTALDMNKALKADLAEAVGLIQKGVFHSEELREARKDFLAKHQGRS